MTRKTIALLAAAFLGGAAFTFGITESLEPDFDPGPIPICNAEQATIVLVQNGTADQYQAWADQGVSVQANTDNTTKGTKGHDVQVVLAKAVPGEGTVSVYGSPGGNRITNNTDGDTMCSAVPGGEEIYYATGFSDTVIDTGGGADRIYAGGCALEGEGVEGDRACDTIVISGRSTDVAKVWGFKVPKGRTQRITEGDEMDHNYVGRGAGKVIVDGGAAPPGVPGGGDHVHPCPIDQFPPTDLRPSSAFTGRGFVLTGVEYLGPETGLGLPLDEVNDPCAYTSRNIT